MAKKPSTGNAFDLSLKKSVFSSDKNFNGVHEKRRTTQTCGAGEIPKTQTVLQKTKPNK